MVKAVCEKKKIVMEKKVRKYWPYLSSPKLTGPLKGADFPLPSKGLGLPLQFKFSLMDVVPPKLNFESTYYPTALTTLWLP